MPSATRIFTHTHTHTHTHRGVNERVPTTTWTEMPQQWDEDGFCTCELEVITCSAVAVGLVVITFIYQVPIGSGRPSCRCWNKIQGLFSHTSEMYSPALWLLTLLMLLQKTLICHRKASRVVCLPLFQEWKILGFCRRHWGLLCFGIWFLSPWLTWLPSHFIRCYLHKHPFSEKFLNSPRLFIHDPGVENSDDRGFAWTVFPFIFKVLEESIVMNSFLFLIFTQFIL